MSDNDFPTIFQTSKADFENAIRKGFWHKILSFLTQSKNELLPFDEVRKHLPMEGQHYLGIREIPVEKIIGSVSRYNDFDRAFMPLRRHTRDRWESVDRAQLQDIILPPIEVYKIGEVYFVRDGNHRVSVAREKGQAFIDAEVIEIDAPVPLDTDTSLDDLILIQEQAEFLTKTRIKEIRPNANLLLTLPGQYSKLFEHINVHRWFMGEEQHREIPYEEAVGDWYDRVYLPLVKIIREHKILDNFPERTETDLYLWIIEHLWYLKNEIKGEISLEEAVEHFNEEYSPNLLQRLLASWKKAIPFRRKQHARLKQPPNQDKEK